MNGKIRYKVHLEVLKVPEVQNLIDALLSFNSFFHEIVISKSLYVEPFISAILDPQQVNSFDSPYNLPINFKISVIPRSLQPVIFTGKGMKFLRMISQNCSYLMGIK